MALVQGDGLSETVSCANLVHAVQSGAPDALLCVQARLSAGLFIALQTLPQTAPCPVLLLTYDAASSRIASALQAGVHAYLPGNLRTYSPKSLGLLVQTAVVRYHYGAASKTALSQAVLALEVRKVVDRAS